MRRGVLNRLIEANGEENYVKQLAKGQQLCLEELQQLADRADVSVTEVPFFDMEVRATYGLRAIGAALFDAPIDKAAEAASAAAPATSKPSLVMARWYDSSRNTRKAFR